MRQLFNPRPIFVGFISLILGIVATVNLVINNSIINIIVFVFACLVLTGLVIALVFGVTKFKFPKIKILVLVFGIVCLAFGGIIGSAVITKPVTQYSGEVNVSGRVTNIKTYNSQQNEWIIGLSIIKKYITQFDYDKGTITFYSDKPLPNINNSQNIILLLIYVIDSILCFGVIMVIIYTLKTKY